MTKVLLSLQTMTLLVLAVLFAMQRSDTAELHDEIAAVRSAAAARDGEAPAPAAAGEEGGAVAAVRGDTRNILKALKLFAEDFQDLRTEFEFLAAEVDGVKRNTWDLMQELKASGRISEEPVVPEKYRELFNPETRQALAEKAAEMGVRLLDDRVEVPGIVAQNRAMLEFFAVISGGKEHETVVALTGNFDREKRLPEGLAGMINACILALGYEKGEPVSATTDGKVVPPKGEPIHLYLEWKGEGGETVRARAEDLIYDLETKQAMKRDPWIYIGSRFEKNYGGSGTVYMADLTGDVVATYSWPNTIVDNTTLEAKDDIYYVCYTPRLPPIGTKVTMVFSREELPAKDFPEGGMETPDEDGGSGK